MLLRSETENQPAPPPPPIGAQPEVDLDLAPLFAPFDWLTELAIPLAIFGLLGCFLWYLIDLRQAVGGSLGGVLRWVSFWFLLACVGITRIRTKYGGQMVAAPYVAALAGVTALFIWAFTTDTGGVVPTASMLSALVFNYGLFILIWWGATRLTRECTIEETFEEQMRSGLFTTLTREGRPGAASERPRHPGRAVLWVFLAALLVFGLGHVLGGTRGALGRHAFYCMAGFLLCTLLLLTLTNLSALRIRARLREVQIGRSLTPTWIVGSLAVVVFALLLGASVPHLGELSSAGRRVALRVPDWARAHARGHWRQSPASGGADNREGSPHRGREATDLRRQAAAGAEQGTATRRAHQTAAPGEEGQPGQRVRPGQQGPPARGESGPPGRTDNQTPTGAQEGQQQIPADSQRQEEEQQAAAATPSETQEGEAPQPEAEASPETAEPPPLPDLSQVGQALAIVLLCLVGLLALWLVYYLIRNVRRLGLRGATLEALLAPFRAFAQALAAFLQRLLGLLSGFGRRARTELPADPFADVFADRRLSASLSPAQVVSHVYRAFLTYCALRGRQRREGETAFEFLGSLPEKVEVVRKDARALTAAYVESSYSPHEIGERHVKLVRGVWERMQPAIDRALAEKKR